ncbi:MAG: ParB/RepB/Spo0J family partition protein [Pseudomonadota bacterium]
MARTTKKTRGLGRGLSALMSDVAEGDSPSTQARPADQIVPIEQVHPNPDQPRRTFGEDALQELASSIAEKGIIQPLIVRAVAEGYQIVAGERRWRAAQIAKLHEVPVILRDYSDVEVLEIAIIENIQRADLNPVDEAAGYRQLMDRFGHTQDQLAQALGKSRSHIANLLRLLTLPDEVQHFLITGQLSAGHARALVGHDDAVALAREVIQRKLSVRDTEKLAKKGPALKKRPVTGAPVPKDADTVQLENELTATLGMKVTIDHPAGNDGGKLVISYKSLEQLDDLMRALGGV